MFSVIGYLCCSFLADCLPLVDDLVHLVTSTVTFTILPITTIFITQLGESWESKFSMLSEYIKGKRDIQTEQPLYFVQHENCSTANLLTV